MSFIDIKDPQKRDRIVQDYINTKKEFQQKSENDKAEGLQQQIELEKTYTPLIKATEESAKKITTEIKNSRANVEQEKGYWKKDFAKSAINYYLNISKNKDKYYGIQKRGADYVMGSKIITIDNQSNITVDNTKFEGTPGLWELIMLTKPSNYTSKDMLEYENLVEKTQVIFNPLTKEKSDRPKATAKYKDILSTLEQAYDDVDDDEGEGNEEEEEEEEGKGQEEEEEDGEKDEEKTKKDESGEGGSGSGIQFLPGNITGLLDRLKLLYAERGAGNIKSTTNEIVGILDELLRLRYLNREEYHAVCRELSC